MGKRNYFTGYGILLHELPVVAVLFTQSNNNEGTMKNSIRLSIRIAKFACREVWNLYREVIPPNHSDLKSHTKSI